MIKTYVAFSANGDYFLLDLLYVKKIVSGKPDAAGEYALEGDIKILDVTGDQEEKGNCIILVRTEGEPVGIRVDDVEELLQWDEDELLPIPEVIRKQGVNYSTGILVDRKRERLYIVLDGQRVEEGAT